MNQNYRNVCKKNSATKLSKNSQRFLIKVKKKSMETKNKEIKHVHEKKEVKSDNMDKTSTVMNYR